MVSVSKTVTNFCYQTQSSTTVIVSCFPRCSPIWLTSSMEGPSNSNSFFAWPRRKPKRSPKPKPKLSQRPRRKQRPKLSQKRKQKLDRKTWSFVSGDVLCFYWNTPSLVGMFSFFYRCFEQMQVFWRLSGSENAGCPVQK